MRPDNLRILLFGASGFIGRNCLLALSKHDCQVHAVSRQAITSKTDRIVWHKADLARPVELEEVFAASRPTYVIHAAWDVSSESYWNAAANLICASVSGHILSQAIKYGVKRLLGIGTCAEYGLEHDLCEEGISEEKPTGSYAITKKATQLLLQSANSASFSTVWVRLFFPYGRFDKATKLLPYIIRQVTNGEVAELSAGTQVRDLLYASDVAEGLMAVLLSDVDGVVNLASGIPVTVAEIAKTIGEMMGRPELIRLGVKPWHAMEAPRWVASVRRLNREVGWRPSISLKDGLAATIDLFSGVAGSEQSPVY